MRDEGPGSRKGELSNPPHSTIQTTRDPISWPYFPPSARFPELRKRNTSARIPTRSHTGRSLPEIYQRHASSSHLSSARSKLPEKPSPLPAACRILRAIFPSTSLANAEIIQGRNVPQCLR